MKHCFQAQFSSLPPAKQMGIISSAAHWIQSNHTYCIHLLNMMTQYQQSQKSTLVTSTGWIRSFFVQYFHQKNKNGCSFRGPRYRGQSQCHLIQDISKILRKQPRQGMEPPKCNYFRNRTLNWLAKVKLFWRVQFSSTNFSLLWRGRCWRTNRNTIDPR